MPSHAANRRRRHDAPTTLRLRLLDHRAQIARPDREEQAAVEALEALVRASQSTLGKLCGLSTRSIAELLVELADLARFIEGRRALQRQRAA